MGISSCMHHSVNINGTISVSTCVSLLFCIYLYIIVSFSAGCLTFDPVVTLVLQPPVS